MLPDILNTGAAGDVAARAVQQRHSTDQMIKMAADKQAAEAKFQPNAVKAYADNRANRGLQERAEQKTEGAPARDADQVELQFALTQDEKVAFSRYLENRRNNENSDENPLDQNDRETIQKAAERITKAMDETIAKNNESRERVEKAVSKWYAILSGADKDAKTSPFELVRLLRAAALGQLDE